MSRRTTVRIRCDGQHCGEAIYDWQFEAEGWTLTEDGRDLCRRCSRGLCSKDVGSRPSWMGVDQYDPCRCVLPAGHGGEHRCRHQVTPD